MSKSEQIEDLKKLLQQVLDENLSLSEENEKLQEEIYTSYETQTKEITDTKIRTSAIRDMERDIREYRKRLTNQKTMIKWLSFVAIIEIIAIIYLLCI